MLVSLCMIARDEEDVLEDCLRSAEGVCDEIVIVDTGSQDGTREIARRHGAQVRDVPWRDDFAAARNAGLEAAHGDWVLILDADERFEGTRAAFEQANAMPKVVAFNVPIVNELDDGNSDIHSAIRAFRLRPGVRYERRLHEQVLQSIMAAAPDGLVAVAPFRIRHIGYRRDRVLAKGKSQRNLELALLEAAQAPDDPFAVYNLGIEHLAAQEFPAAADAFHRVRDLVPENYPWKSRLYKVEAQTLVRLGRQEEAVGLLREAILYFPKFTDLYFLLGVAQQELGDLRAAERAFRRCLRLGPASCPPHDGVDPELGRTAAGIALGGVLARRGRLREAREVVWRAVRMRPGWLPAVQSLVEIAMAAGDDLDALSDQPPPDPLEVGAVLFRLGHYAHALRQFERAETFHPDLPPDHLYLKALVQLRLGDLEAASASAARGRSSALVSTRAYLSDLVDLMAGRVTRAELSRAYPPEHPIWREVQHLTQS